VEVAVLTTREDFERASLLYQRVFGYDGQFSLNTKLMRSIGYAGGANAGAWSDQGDLIGFVYGFPAIGEDGPYLFSQASCVDDLWRGRGVGSALKYAQLREARLHGLPTMRWAFDPANSRNARLNLGRLGARARWFQPDFYDNGESDRLVVEWDGSEPSAPPLACQLDSSVALLGAVQQVDSTHVAITLPLEPRTEGPSRRRLLDSLRGVLDDGFVAMDCRRISPRVAAYICEAGAA
jgi:predicted GNAT superfamily acetyltransferase